MHTTIQLVCDALYLKEDSHICNFWGVFFTPMKVFLISAPQRSEFTRTDETGNSCNEYTFCMKLYFIHFTVLARSFIEMFLL